MRRRSFVAVIVAFCYARGQGVTKDKAKAAHWYAAAAAQGHPQAQFQLGMCAFKPFTFGSNSNVESSVVMVGLCYKRGSGVIKDEARAVHWFAAAAAQSHAQAQRNLGTSLLEPVCDARTQCGKFGIDCRKLLLQWSGHD